MNVILNGVPGEITEIRRNMPNIGLGPSTATVGHEFVADPQATESPEYKFIYDGTIVLNRKKVKTYKAFRRDAGVWIYVMTFSAPASIKADAVGQFFNEQEL